MLSHPRKVTVKYSDDGKVRVKLITCYSSRRYMHQHPRLANLRWPFPSKDFTEDMTACTLSSVAEYESTLEFVGNLILFLGGIVCIFIVHVAVASGVEAYMTLKRQVIDLIKRANDQGIPVSSLSSIVLRKNSGKRPAVLTDARDIEDIGGSCDGLEDDYEETTASGIQNDHVECRDNSSSVWLHFPHLELVFLFFAFQGAVTTEARVIRHAGLNCLSVFFVAIVYMVRNQSVTKILDPLRILGNKAVCPKQCVLLWKDRTMCNTSSCSNLSLFILLMLTQIRTPP